MTTPTDCPFEVGETYDCYGGGRAKVMGEQSGWLVCVTVPDDASPDIEEVVAFLCSPDGVDGQARRGLCLIPPKRYEWENRWVSEASPNLTAQRYKTEQAAQLAVSGWNLECFIHIAKRVEVPED